ncbi:MAG: phospholipase D family protein [Anaerolineae bacterium]|nr:phospholipase D family protein [Anaerolineae bacterium]
MKIILQPFSEQRLGAMLKTALSEQGQIWNSFQAAVAFAKRSGVAHLQNELQGFVDRGGYVRMVIGIDQYGTSIEALSDLLNTVGDTGEIWINHDSNNYITFHPKVYLFEAESSALLIVGSGNLTEGGLYTNDEASLVYELDLSKADNQALLGEVKEAINQWCNDDMDSVRKLDEVLLQELIELDYIRSETKTQTEDEAEIERDRASKDRTSPVGRKLLFGRGVSRRRPTRHRTRVSRKEQAVEIEFAESEQAQGFVMTLMHTDVGTGQTTPGTSRRSPEIFVPLAARKMYPDFWGWPNSFIEDPVKPGKFDRSGVSMRIGGEVIRVNMMTWPDKHDFRLRSEALRSAGHEGDILRIEKTSGSQDFAYYVEIIPAGTSAYEYFSDLCVNRTPNSQRRWGYYG